MEPQTKPTEQIFLGNDIPENPKLSIVTPVYNGMPYLEEALDSVRALSKQVSLEHIVADGCSTDGSQELLKESSFVRGVSRVDDGLYSAVNWAIRQARAPYIQWLNADDKLVPDFSKRAIQLLERYPEVDAILGSTVYVNSQEKLLERRFYDSFEVTNLWTKLETRFYNINSAVYRSTVFHQENQFNSVRFLTGADTAFQLKFIQQNPKLIVLDDHAYVFRIHENSLTTGSHGYETVTKAIVRRYNIWCKDPTLPAELREGFAQKAVEVEVGWLLKCLRTGAGEGRAAAARRLRQLFQETPAAMRAALPAWASHQLRRAFGR